MKHLFTVALLSLITIQLNSQDQRITLIKTGGNQNVPTMKIQNIVEATTELKVRGIVITDLDYYEYHYMDNATDNNPNSGIPLGSSINDVSTGFHEIIFEENGSLVIDNWAKQLHLIGDLITYDPENNLDDVSYTIEITSADVYEVSKQFTLADNPERSFDNFAYSPEVMHISGQEGNDAFVTNITIKAVGGYAEFKWMDDLFHGGYISPGEELTVPCNDEFRNLLNDTALPIRTPAEWDNCKFKVNGRSRILPTKNQARIQPFFLFSKCKDLEMENVLIDGNASGIFGVDAAGGGAIHFNIGTQYPYDGIYLSNCQDVTLVNVSANNFGQDGIVTNYTNTDNVSLENCEFIGNSRTGMAVLGGTNITVNNCKFNESGTNPIKARPRNGVDLEPTASEVHHVTFTDCEFLNNVGFQVINNKDEKVTDIIFDNCTFKKRGGKANAVLMSANRTQFIDCTLYGGFMRGHRGDVPSDGTKFIRTNFFDADPDDTDSDGNGNESIIIKSNSENLSFDDCKFYLTKSNNKMFELTPAGNELIDYAKFNDCTFNVHAPDAIDSEIYKSIFTGNSTFNNLLSFDPASADQINNSSVFKFRNLIGEGSTDACFPNSIEVNGPNMFHIKNNYNIGEQDGYFNLNFNKDACFNGLALSQNYGINSQLNINSDATYLTSNGQIFNNGKIFFGSDAYIKIWQTDNQSINTSSSDFYIHEDFITDDHPIWIDQEHYLNRSQNWNDMTINDQQYSGSHSYISGNVEYEFEAIEFNDESDPVIIPYTPKFDALNGNKMTFEFSIRAEQNNNATSSIHDVIFKKGDDIEIGLRGINGSAYIKVEDETHYLPYVLRDGLCHLVTISYDRTIRKARLFVDGKFKKGKTINPALPIQDLSNGDIEIGSTLYTDSKISIGKVRTWNRIFEKQDLCHNAESKDPLNENNLIAYWNIQATDNTELELFDDAADPANSDPVTGTLNWVSQSELSSCFSTDNDQIPQGSFLISDSGSDLHNNDFQSMVYPNPTDGLLNVNLEKRNANEDIEIIVLNSLGQNVIQKTFSPSLGKQKVQLDLKKEQVGLYFISIKSGNDIETIKVLLSK